MPKCSGGLQLRMILTILVSAVSQSLRISMSDAKKQHYVPQFYLREFLDPNTPLGQDPYVWVFAKDGKKKQRRAPKNILWKTELYTLDVEGAKRYELEQALSNCRTG